MRRLVRAVMGSIKMKLLLFMIAILLSTVLSIGYFSYTDTSRTIQSDVEQFSSQILRQANLHLSRYLQEYDREMLIIASGNEFVAWRNAGREDRFELVRIYQQVSKNYTQSMFSQHPEIMLFTLYREDGNELHFTGTVGIKKGFTIADEPKLLELVRSSRSGLTVMRSNAYYDPVGVGRNSQGVPVLSMIRKFTEEGLSASYIRMDVSLEPILTILQEIELGREGIGLIADSSGLVIAHPNVDKLFQPLDPDIQAHLLASESGAFFRPGTNEMIVHRNIPGTAWTSLVIVPYEEAASSIYRVRNATIIIACISLLLASLLAVAASTKITKRIVRLRHAMKSVQLGHFHVRADVKGNDEIAELGVAYNNMLSHLEQTVEELAETQTMQQNAVLVAMQSQINAHFLYNTLETINSMAHLNHQPEIERVTVALSHMLRYISDYKNTVVTVDDELTHLERYLQIMEAHFGGDLRYELFVEEECRTASCLKAILQPIAENCIKHGIEATGKPLHIHIRADLAGPDHVRVLIADDGGGFPPEALARLQAKMGQELAPEEYKHLSRIGLLNVYVRIRMFYRGAGAEMRICNRESGGAAVELIFPCRATPGKEAAR